MFQVIKISVIIATYGLPKLGHGQGGRVNPGSPLLPKVPVLTLAEQCEGRKIVTVGGVVQNTHYFLSGNFWAA